MYQSAGIAEMPSWDDNGDGTANIGSGTVRLYSSPAASGTLEEYTLAAVNNLPFIDEATQYVIATYTAGTAAISVTSNVLDINESTCVPIYTVYRTGTTLHKLAWNSLAYNLATRLHYRLVKTDRFRHESGLVIGESSGRIITVSEGRVFYGVDSNLLAAYSSATNAAVMVHHVGGVWTRTPVSQYNNSQYDDGANLQTLSPNRYGVNWVYRGVDDSTHVVYILGQGNYKLNEAIESRLPASIPPYITSHHILVGRIIVEFGDPAATQIESAFDIDFDSGGSVHNDTLQKQGGSDILNEFYHLTAAEIGEVRELATIQADRREPTGFPYADQAFYSRLSFDNGTRYLTIEPATPTYSSFRFWVQGVQYTKTSAQTVGITDTEGMHSFYFDTDGVLKTMANPTQAQVGQLIREKAGVAILYWDSDNKQQIYFSNERHGITMDGIDHEMWHWRFGSFLLSGGTLTSIVTDASGDLSAHAQFGTVTSMLLDEDLDKMAPAVSSTVGLPIFWRSGASGYWRKDTNPGYSVTVAGSGRLCFNEFTGGAWKKTEVTNMDFVLCHVFLTNDISNPFIAVMGQAEYATLNAARIGATTELNSLILSGIPSREWVAMGTVIFQTSNGYANAIKARVVSTDEGADYVSWLERGVSPSSGLIVLHNDLGGLDVGDFQHLSAADKTQLTTSIQATNHFHIPNIDRQLTVGQVGSECDYTPTLGFGAIAAAITQAGVIGYSADNPLMVKVYPGTYIEPAEVVVNAGLYVVSSEARIDTTFAVALDPTKDLYLLNGGTIAGLHLIGVGAPGKALVRCATPGTLSTLQSIAINGCYAGVIVEAGAAAVIIELGMTIGSAGMNIGTGVIGTGAGTFVGIQGAFATVPAAILPVYAPANPMYRAIEANNGAEVLVSSGTFRIATQAPNSGDVMFADNGAVLTISGVDISNSDVALHIGSSGSGTIINALAGFQGGNNLNIVCESATGKIFSAQSVDSTKQFLVPGTTMVGTLQLRSDQITAFLGDARYQYLASGRQADLGDFFADYTSTGVCDGGVVTHDAGLYVDVTAGDGWCRRPAPNDDAKWVEWIDTNLLLTANSTNYVYVNGETGVVSATVGVIGYGDSILLATVVTDGATVRFLHQTRNYLTGPMEQLRTYLLATRKQALDTGLICEQGTGVRNIDVAAGSYYLGLDHISYAGAADATWSYFYGTNGATEVAGQTQVDITQYDNAGALAAMTGGWFRSDTLLLTSDGRLSLIYGTAQYASKILAEAATIGNTPTFIEPSVFPLYRVIVEQGVGIASFVDVRPNPAAGTTGGGGAGVSDHGALTGLTDDDHAQYLLVSGTRSMTGGLNMGASNITMGAGNTVDGVDISDHSALHLPGGADELTMGTPVAVTVGGSPSAGDSADFARGNHQHTISGTAFEASGAVGAHASVQTGVHGLSITAGKTLTVQNSVTLTGTDTTTHTLPSTSSTVARTDAAQVFTGVQEMTSAKLTTPEIINTPTGTGVATAATASTLALRDANGNVSAVNFLNSYLDTPSSGGTLTLTVASPRMQVISGTLAHTVRMPVSNNLVLGQAWEISNLSTGLVTVQSSGANTITVMAPGTYALVTCILTSGTDAASWSLVYTSAIATSGKKLVVNNSLTLSGTDATTHTFPSTTSTLARTDSGQTFTGTNVFSTAISIGAASGATGILELLGVTSGKVTLKSKDIAGTPTFVLPSALGSPGQALVDPAGDGILGWGSGPVPATITVADTTSATCYLALFEAATGNIAPKTDAAATYNASTGALASTLFSANTITANIAFVPDADGGADLGTTTLGFSAIHLSSGSVINWVNGDITLTHALNTLTLAGASTLALGTTNVTMTGSLGETASRLTKGWFADLESTAGIVLGLDATAGTGNTAGYLKLFSAGDNAFYTTFTAGTQSANATYTLPTAMPGTTQFLQSTNAGVLSWASAPIPTTITVADTANTGCYVGLFEAATGDIAPKTDINIRYNAVTSALTLGSFAVTNTPGVIVLSSAGNSTTNNFTISFTAGTQLANTAYTLPTAFPGSTMLLQSTNAGVMSWTSAPIPTTITVADTTSTTCYLALFEATTGDIAPKTDAAATYNASTGALTSALFSANTITANTAFVPDINNGADLGTTSLGFGALHMGTGSAINWVNGDVTLTHAANTLTLAGATTLALGSTNLTLTGSIADTTNRVLKGWFTDLECTNAIAGSITGNAATVAVAATTDTTSFIALLESATGNQGVKTLSSATMNATTGQLTVPIASVSANAADGTTAKLANVMFGTADPGAGFLAAPHGTIYIKHVA